MALAMAFVGEAVPKARTGSAMGLLGTMSAIGTALGPSLGGILISGAGWRAIFLVNVPLGILALLLVHRCLPADRPRPGTDRAGFDALGTLLLGLALSAGMRNISSRIKGDAVFASTSTNRPTPSPAASSSATLSTPKLPRPMVMASA